MSYAERAKTAKANYGDDVHKNQGAKGVGARIEKITHALAAYGDDGANIETLMNDLNWKPVGVKTAASAAVKEGRIVKHPSLEHWFLAEEPVKKTAPTKTRSSAKVVNLEEESVVTDTKMGFVDRVMFAFGYKRI